MRRKTTRVSLGTTFLMLAAGGSAACDSAESARQEEHVFYCTTPDGIIVDEDYCDDDDRDGASNDGGALIFILWHSPVSSSTSGLRPGMKVPAGGQSFKWSDTAQRQAWGLPATGNVRNGVTTKTNVVGRGSGVAPARGGAGE